MNPNATNLSGRIRIRRGSTSVRRSVAEIGISAATLSRVERGDNFDITTLLRLCAWLQCSPNEALGWKDGTQQL